MHNIISHLAYFWIKDWKWILLASFVRFYNMDNAC